MDTDKVKGFICVYLCVSVVSFPGLELTDAGLYASRVNFFEHRRIKAVQLIEL